MASFTTKLYFNTGFNQANIPDSAAILETIPATNVDSVWLLQDYTGQIKINIQWDNVCNADYCQIGTNYYFIIGITMSNVNTAILDIQLDAITTVGINNLNIINGWVTRRHVSNDELFANNLSEDFVPIEVAKIDMSNLEPPGGIDSYLAIVASTIDLDETNKIADEYVNADLEPTISVPHIYATKTYTECSMALGVSSNRVTKILPHTTLFVIAANGQQVGNYNEALSNLWSLGLTDAITSSYIVKWYGFSTANYTAKEGSAGGIAKITLPTYSVSPSDNLNYKWNTGDYVVKNNKVFSGQFNMYRCSSVCGGGSEDFLANQLQGGANEKPWFWINGDVSPNGTTYCRPFYFEGNDGTNGADGLIKAVTGVPWQNQQLVFGGASGSYQAGLNQDYTRMYRVYDRAANMYNPIAKGVQTALSPKNISNMQATQAYNAPLYDTTFRMGNRTLEQLPPVYLTGTIGPKFSAQETGGIIDSFIRGAGRSVVMEDQFRQQELNFQTGQNLVEPTVKFPLQPSLADYVGNGFYLTRERLSLNDTIRFDKYLTAYGYSTSEPLTIDAFNCRQYFNYLKITDFNFTFKNNIRNFGLRMKQLIINTFENGVRIWHIKPDAIYFNDNPIKE